MKTYYNIKVTLLKYLIRKYALRVVMALLGVVIGFQISNCLGQPAQKDPCPGQPKTFVRGRFFCVTEDGYLIDYPK